MSETTTCSFPVPNSALAAVQSFSPLLVFRELRTVCSDWFLYFSLGSSGIQMYLCNKEHYGYLPIPLKPHQTLQEDIETFIHVQIEAMSEWPRSPEAGSYSMAAVTTPATFPFSQDCTLMAIRLPGLNHNYSLVHLFVSFSCVTHEYDKVCP